MADIGRAATLVAGEAGTLYPAGVSCWCFDRLHDYRRGAVRGRESGYSDCNGGWPSYLRQEVSVTLARQRNASDDHDERPAGARHRVQVHAVHQQGRYPMRQVDVYGRLNTGNLTERPLSKIEFSPADPWGTWYESTICDAVIAASWHFWAEQH